MFNLHVMSNQNMMSSQNMMSNLHVMSSQNMMSNLHVMSSFISPGGFLRCPTEKLLKVSQTSGVWWLGC